MLTIIESCKPELSVHIVTDYFINALPPSCVRRLAKAHPVSKSWLKNKFRVPRYADLPRDQLTDAILYVNAMDLRCAKQLADDSNPPLPLFQHGEFGVWYLIRLGGRWPLQRYPLGHHRTRGRSRRPHRYRPRHGRLEQLCQMKGT